MSGTKRRKVSHSCSECRRRRKLCDRRIPRCSNCVARGVEHLCRWGDERDDQLPEGRSTPSTRDSPPLQIPNEASLVYELKRCDMDTFVEGGTDLDGDAVDAADDLDLSLELAQTLSELFITAGHFSMLFDARLVQTTLHDALAATPDGQLADMRRGKPDIFALILTFCASGLLSIPQTYAVALGIVKEGSELTPLMADWARQAQTALTLLKVPTFEYIQVRNLYSLNLAFRLYDRGTIATADSTIRAARRLGLDRLGTAQEDEERWKQLDMGMHGRHLLDHGAVWAARTFQARDRRARNLGRLQWTVIVSKDWVHAPMNGCYTIAPSSFTTGLPDSSAFDTPAPGRYEMLKNLRFSADVMRRFADACGTAEAYGCEIDYMTILQLDSELMQALEGLPANLRIHKPEDVTKFEKRGRMGAIMATSTLWHRLFVIHRPCILLSRSNPAKYSLSSTRTWYFAVQMLKLVRYDDSVIMKNVAFLFRMVQAALVLITHLFFFSDRLNATEIMEAHDHVQYVITVSKRVEGVCTPRSPFCGQARKVEAILAAASRLQASNRKTSASTATTPQSSTDAVLDDHLTRLLYGCDAQWGDVSPGGAVAEQPAAPSDALWQQLLQFLNAEGA